MSAGLQSSQFFLFRSPQIKFTLHSPLSTLPRFTIHSSPPSAASACAFRVLPNLANQEPASCHRALFPLPLSALWGNPQFAGSCTGSRISRRNTTGTNDTPGTAETGIVSKHTHLSISAHICRTVPPQTPQRWLLQPLSPHQSLHPTSALNNALCAQVASSTTRQHTARSTEAIQVRGVFALLYPLLFMLWSGHLS